MKQNKNDPNHSDDDLTVEAETLRRLASIQKEDESCDDTLTRLLDDAVVDVPLKAVLTHLLNKFEDAVSIDVDMAGRVEEPGTLIISVHTPEVELEEDVTLYPGRETRAIVESQDGKAFHQPFDIIATCSGPKYETISTTPVYKSDDIYRTEPVTLDEGLEQLRAKIGKPADEVRDLVQEL